MNSVITTPSSALFAVVLFTCLMVACADSPSNPLSLPEASALPLKPDLPDPLVMLGGRRVTSTEGWVNEHRPELKTLFQYYMYGAIPPKPTRQKAEVVSRYPDFHRWRRRPLASGSLSRARASTSSVVLRSTGSRGLNRHLGTSNEIPLMVFTARPNRCSAPPSMNVRSYASPLICL
jgi:hypothetical protein